jgi:hypothetical protein
MTQVFASTELVIGLHARKIVCALDMFDWEESGAKGKRDINISSILSNHVGNSLKTWMPKGSGNNFYLMMNALGTIIGDNKQGNQAAVKTMVESSFPSKDKQHVLDLMKSIRRFYQKKYNH